MSRSFIGFGQVPYIGQPFTNPIKLSGIAGTQLPLLFNWLIYGASTLRPNINVLVDIDNAVCRAMDQVRSVYIDNLGSDNPVYVYFPDTGYTVAAKPNSEGWYPAFTNAKKIWIIGEGFLTGDIPTAFVILCNIALPASVNTEIDNAVALWRASPTISRGSTIYNSTLGIPALGDQLFTANPLSATVIGDTVPLWNSPYASGFLYITSIVIYGLGVSNAVLNSGAMVLESTGIAGVLATPRWIQQPTIPPGYVGEIFRLTGLQTKLDAAQSWRARTITAGDGGTIQIYSSFTQQP